MQGSRPERQALQFQKALQDALAAGFKAAGMKPAAAKTAAGRVNAKKCSCGMWFD